MRDTSAAATPDNVMIRLDRVTKHYPGQTAPAVSDLSLDVRAGEIVVLLGPSGCGKTTTLRLINRLIEPSSGRIYLDGEDVTRVDPDQLRRRIGYVIQQVGLFPHMTIAENIGLIPRTVGWEKKRIRARIDELLRLVGLEPTAYRDRYPKQLSGGQQQRVGVARALAADPPAMLMDEPFGALDPITRERLQAEFLNLQAQIRKTILLVTHDVAEAVKLGDRIAVLADHACVVQYDTPAAILGTPADEFVASFIGSGAAIRGLRLERVGSMTLEPVETVREDTANTHDGSAPGRMVVVDDNGIPLRWLRAADRRAAATSRSDLAVLKEGQTAYDAVDAMLRARDDRVLVVDEHSRPVGALSWTSIVEAAPSDDSRRPAPVDPIPGSGGPR